MTRNTKGGKAFKKCKKNDGEMKQKQLILKDDDTEYAKLIKPLGNSRFETSCNDGITRIAHIRGKMQKKIWLKAGDVVLVSLRDFQQEKCDIIHKYSDDEVIELIKCKHITNDKHMADHNNDIDIGIDISNQEGDKIEFDDI